ncbi:MAG: hypothetical protein MIO90_03670 [Methanomassiliicoccales archaeon]|nr:hypothetical protein [Methanomassiliicoccales archaeon]
MTQIRPLRVTIIAVLSILAGMIFLFPILDIFGLVHLIDLTDLTFREGPLVVTTLVIAIANFMIGIGCMLGWRPIWFYLIVISIINFVFALITLYNANGQAAILIGAFWLGVSIYIMISVQSKRTREWFFD